MYIPCYMQTCISYVHCTSVCNCKQKLQYGCFFVLYNFSALNEKLLFNWHTQDNREWWYSVVQDSVMLYTGSFEMRINLPFSYDGVGSDSFCLYQMAANSTWVTTLKNTIKCCANWTYAAYYFRVSSLCKCLISAYLF